jgi:hypothetical protein
LACVLEQGVNRGEAGAAVAPLLFEVLQERADEGSVEVGEAELAGCLAGPVAGEGEPEPGGVAVNRGGGDGVGAGLLLPDEPVGEEPPQGGGEVGHDAFHSSWQADSSRPAARPRSSGTAERYQLSRYRNNWYYSDSRVIPDTRSLARVTGPVAWDDVLW